MLGKLDVNKALLISLSFQQLVRDGNARRDMTNISRSHTKKQTSHIEKTSAIKARRSEDSTKKKFTTGSLTEMLKKQTITSPMQSRWNARAKRQEEVFRQAQSVHPIPLTVTVLSLGQ